MTLELNTKNDLYCFGQDVVDKLVDRAPSDKCVELNIRVRGQLIETTKTSAYYGCKSSVKFVFAPHYGNIEVKDCAQYFYEYLKENGFEEVG